MKVNEIINDFVAFIKCNLDEAIESEETKGDRVYVSALRRVGNWLDTIEDQYLKEGYIANPAYFYPAHLENRRVLGKYGFKTTGEVMVFIQKKKLMGYAVVRGRDILKHKEEWKIDNEFDITMNTCAGDQKHA